VRLRIVALQMCPLLGALKGTGQPAYVPSS
jgi:hypothetical protein